MTFYQPNPTVRPTGAEAGEYVDKRAQLGDDDDRGSDPSARPSGSPPVEPAGAGTAAQEQDPEIGPGAEPDADQQSAPGGATPGGRP